MITNPNPRSLRLLLVVMALIGSILASLVGCGGGGGDDGTTVIAPTILTQPSAISIATGEDATFSVVASGTSLSYQWYKVNTTSSQGEAISGATSTSYVIADATTSDAGTYYVVATNSAGSATSDSVTLTVSNETGDANVGVS